MKVPRGFESHPLRTRVREAEKIAFSVAKTRRAPRFSELKVPQRMVYWRGGETIWRDSLCFDFSKGTLVLRLIGTLVDSQNAKRQYRERKDGYAASAQINSVCSITVRGAFCCISGG